MLSIVRTQPRGAAPTALLDATVVYRQSNRDTTQMPPDITFEIRTYQKIAEDKPEKGNSKEDNTGIGDKILLPLNMFFETLSEEEQARLYEMYASSHDILRHLKMETLRDTQNKIQDVIYKTINKLDLVDRMITFCRQPAFVYPDLEDVGNKPHHSAEKTFLEEEYIELTAISILCKMLMPIWGEFIQRLSLIDANTNQREKLALDLIEPTLEKSTFGPIYRKLFSLITSVTAEIRKNYDKQTIGGANTAYVLTHGGGVDDRMFNEIVMAAIIVKRMASYECFATLREGKPPNAMVYIDNGIRNTTDTKIKGMRKDLKTMPHRPLANHESEDNSSIIDHTSKTSKKPIDVPILVTKLAELWGIPKLLVETKTPLDVFDKAMAYYMSNSFDVNPIAQAMVASFVGTRFGGSKCLQYLDVYQYYQLVTMLQVYLIRIGKVELAALASSISSTTLNEGILSPMGMRLRTTGKSGDEYIRMMEVIKGFIEKPGIPVGRGKGSSKKVEPVRIDFTNHIQRMIEWLTDYTHSENMAPALWDFAKVENRPIPGSDCRYDENIIRHLCDFYLRFHEGNPKPFEIDALAA